MSSDADRAARWQFSQLYIPQYVSGTESLARPLLYGHVTSIGRTFVRRLAGSCFALTLALAACTADLLGPPGEFLDPPTNLRYDVEASGTPDQPAGVLLRWDDNLEAGSFRVYSRGGTSGSFAYRAETSSPSFHERGTPQLQYYVTAMSLSGNESKGSTIITVDERLALDRPSSLGSISVNGGIFLYWTDNPATVDPAGFRNYRVYSADYDLDANRCREPWRLEGTTVAAEFQVGALANGIPMCFAVSAISIEGFESLWSPTRADTPRDDARNVVATTRQSADPTAGFRFWRDQNGDAKVQVGELGQTLPGSSPLVDFTVDRDAAGRIFLTPVRSGTLVTVYGNAPVGDLTDIDAAPLTGFTRTAREALVGWGYVFQMDGGDGSSRFGGLRVTHVGQNVVIFDWSFQRDPGNPELTPPQ